MIDKLVGKYNTSFVFVLPLFKDIIANIKDKRNVKYNIHGMLVDNGLINTYLLNSRGEFDKKLRLLFNKNIIESIEDKVNKPIYNLLDVFINCKHFSNIIRFEEYVLIELNIDEIWHDDVKLIMESKYSKTSEKYKNYIINYGNYIISKQEDVTFLYLENLAGNVVKKTNTIKDLVKKAYNIDDVTDILEFYDGFNQQKEVCLLKNF